MKFVRNMRAPKMIWRKTIEAFINIAPLCYFLKQVLFFSGFTEKKCVILKVLTLTLMVFLKAAEFFFGLTQKPENSSNNRAVLYL